MIVATSFGMFMPALRPAKSIPPGDNRTLQVRSRRKIDLDRLRALYLPDLGPTIQLPKTDYQYRAYCTLAQWGEALALMALDINYTKFKDTPLNYFKDSALSYAYSRIWSAALDAFPEGSVYRSWQRSRTNAPAATRTWRGSAPIRTWWDDAAHSQPTHASYRDTDHVLGHVFPDREPTAMELQEIADELERDERESRHKNMLDDHYESMHTGPVVRNGRVDHSRCEHAQSKNARERCRRRLRKAGQL